MSDREGSYKWQINDHTLVKKIFHATNKQKFESDVFQIGDVIWKMVIYPNGWSEDRIDSFDVCLQLIKLPPSWKSIIINRSIQSPQTKSSSMNIDRYNNNGESYGWSKNTLRLKEIKESNLKQLIFVAHIKILKIILTHTLNTNNRILYNYKSKWIKTSTLMWKLDKKTLIAAKNAYNGKRFESNMFDNMWCIALYPNGDTQSYAGKCIVFLKLCAYPPNANICSIHIEWNVCIKEMNFFQQKRDKYTIGEGSDWMNISTFEAFKNNESEEMEIKMDVLICKEYDKNNKEIQERYGRKIEEKDNSKEIQVLKDEMKRYKQEINYQLRLYEAKIKLFSSDFSQKMQDMKSLNRTQIKAINDRITKMFEREQKENGNINLSNLDRLRFFVESELNLPQYFEAIIDAGFKDISSLTDLTNEDLKEMNVKIAHRKIILKAIQQKQPKNT